VNVRDLAALGPADAPLAGRKATSLAALMRDGIRVPPGFVVLGTAFDRDGRLRDDDRDAILVAARAFGDAALAVRSSAVAEDLPDASFAGRYLTLLDVRGEAALLDAIARVHASAMNVLVQPMLVPTAAGVAFSADPVTGDRDTVLVQAVRGLGDRLVDGRATAEAWYVRGGSATLRGGGQPAIDAAQARAVATLANDVASRRGVPQDLEWAIADGALYALQARQMTALPAAVRWDAPSGAFARNFRLGEWLGDPVTPLFESWLLTTMEETMHAEYAHLIGQPAPRPLHAIVNGWYYYSLNFLPASIGGIARMLPGILVRLPRHARRLAPVFPPLARLGIDVYVREWREVLLPEYLQATEASAAEVTSATPGRLCGMVDELAVLAGRYFTSVTFVAGYGWKTEIPLAQFYRRHLAPVVGGHPQLLLRGLVRPATSAHAVQTLDWSFPTHGESLAADEPDPGERYERLVREREKLEREARAALAATLVARFDRLLAEAQRAAVLREEQVADLTRAWPVMRRALTRIGEALVIAGAIREPDDVYYLRRDELAASVRGERSDRAALVTSRRARWDADRRLVAPLVIGRLPTILQTLLGAADRALRDPHEAAPDAVRGVPASPGRATGRARIVRSGDEFDQLRAGEVLVCRVTTPSWTPLFARAAAVVTDVGSPSAHASIIAREYGIPAVVGTGDGTTRIADGAIVTVDGGAGLVLPSS
jgi:pyruvate,water dikinase